MKPTTMKPTVNPVPSRSRHEEGFLLTPGSLFSPQQSPTTWMRFNIANCGDPELSTFLCRYLDGVARRAS